MTIEDIYIGAARLINGLIQEEFRAQGHTLTGNFEASLSYDIKKTRYTATLTGTGAAYGMIVNVGLQPGDIKDKMYPGLVAYFAKRGALDPKAAASATLRKWKEEGMSTQASKRFSETGARQHFVESAMLNSSIDEYMINLFDFGIDQQFNKVKNERI